MDGEAAEAKARWREPPHPASKVPSESDLFLHAGEGAAKTPVMVWRRVSKDVPEGEPILVACADQVVVALAFPGDYYFPDMTFMDARTFDILPRPSHWTTIEPLPASRLGGDAAECRRAA